jgi:hypothetical protein
LRAHGNLTWKLSKSPAGPLTAVHFQCGRLGRCRDRSPVAARASQRRPSGAAPGRAAAAYAPAEPHGPGAGSVRQVRRVRLDPDGIRDANAAEQTTVTVSPAYAAAERPGGPRLTGRLGYQPVTVCQCTMISACVHRFRSRATKQTQQAGPARRFPSLAGPGPP